MGVYETLVDIQRDLRAPKNQTNTFGKYKFRSCEDILEAVKPLLNGLALVVSDELVFIGDRYYVKATAILTNGENEVATTAYAREEQDKKGFDASQITGSASSYARKYALNGLFLIDDTKDADTMDNRKDEKKPDKKTSPPQKPSPNASEGSVDPFLNEGQAKDIVRECAAHKRDWKDILATYGVSKFSELRESQLSLIYDWINA